MRKIAKVLALVLIMNAFLSQLTYGMDDMNGHWAKEVVREWSDYDVINGYPDGSMKPDQTITKGEFAQILANLFREEIGQEENKLTDINPGDWYADVANHMVEKGILDATDDVFEGEHKMTRMEVIMVLYDLFKMEGTKVLEQSFIDIHGLSRDELLAVSYFRANGFIKGYPDKTLRPYGEVTRGELMQILDSIIDLYVFEDGTVINGDTFGNVLIVADGVVFEDTTVEGQVFTSANINQPDNGWEAILGQLVVLLEEIIEEEAVAADLDDDEEEDDEEEDDDEDEDNNDEDEDEDNDDEEDDDEDEEDSEDEWVLTWADEFDGDSVDTSKWTYDIGNWIVDGDGNGVARGWGNNELEYYTDSSNNSFVEDGYLIIRALEEETSDQFGTYDYTSAKLKSKGLFSQKYGRFEARIKLPAGQGFWPAFWMLPEEDVYGGWAASGEIDILEAWGSKPHIASGAIHYGGIWPDNTHTGDHYDFPDEGTYETFHEYAIEWTPGEIKWFVDDVNYMTMSNWYNQDSNGEIFAYPAPFDQEFYLIMNLAVGGWFDGDPDASTQFPSQMEVDYVRAYELEGGYDEAKAPTIEKEALPVDAKTPDAAGNYISNGEFSSPVQVNADGSLDFGHEWNFVHLADFGGNGSVTVENNEARVDITSAGSQNYAVQLIQLTTLGTGRYYEVSFDAKASAERDIVVKMGGGADRGYASYSKNNTFELTDTVQTYTYQFLMSAETDVNARLEMNLGLDTNSVYLSNVSLKEIDSIVLDNNIDKTPLADGNMVYNGAFDKVSIDKMAYWNLLLDGSNAHASVDDSTRELKVSVADGGGTNAAIILEQQGLAFDANTDYKVTFDARGSEARDLTVKFLSEDGLVTYFEETIALTGVTDVYEMTFTNSEASNTRVMLHFEMGGSDADVYLDNVLVKATSVDYSTIDTHPIKNGDFSSGFDSWGQYVHWSSAANVYELNGQAEMNITNAGVETWGILLSQGDFTATSKADYTLSFDALSTVDRNIEVVIENASYNRYFSEKVALTEGFDTYTFTIDFPVDDDVTLKFLAGNTDETIDENVAHVIVIDNVDMHVIGAPDPDGGDGGSDSDNGGNTGSSIVTNGTFDTDTSGWNTYMNDGSNAEIAVVGGEAKVSFPAYAGWEKWSTQFYQEGLTIEAGETYTLSFDAMSSVARDIWVEMTDMANQTVTLSDSMTTYSFEFTASAATNAGKLNFLLGTENLDGSLFPAGSYIILDNISIVGDGSGSGDGGSDSGDSGSNDGPIVTNGTFDTDTSGWNTYMNDGSNAEIAVVGGEAKVSFPAYAGWEKWSTQFYQEGLTLEAGETYTLSFDAMSSVARDIWVEMTDMANQTVTLSDSMTTYSFEFTASAATNAGKLNFLLGTENLDGSLFPAGSYIILDNISIVGDGSGSDSGDSGSGDSGASDGPIVTNGTFDTDTSGWNTYMNDGSNAEITVVGGEAKVSFPAYAGWEKWSTQFYQEGLTLEAGETYTLSFDAMSSVARDIWVEMTDMANQTVTLSDSMTTYSFEFTASVATNAGKLNFLLGTENLDGSLFPAGSYIILDNISIVGDGSGSDSGDAGSDSGDSGSGDSGADDGTTTIAGQGSTTIQLENGTNFWNAETTIVDGRDGVVNTPAGTPMTVDVEVEVETTGTYTLTFHRKNVGPNGIYMEMRVDGVNTANTGVGPSDVWTEDVTAEFQLTAGTHTLQFFAAPGEDTLVVIDKVVISGDNTPGDGGSDAGDGGSGDTGSGGSGSDTGTPTIAGQGTTTIQLENGTNFWNAQTTTVDGRDGIVNTPAGTPMTVDVEVEVEMTGTYTLTYHKKNIGPNGTYMEMRVNGVNTSNTIVVASDVWTEDVTAEFQLTAGTHTLQFFSAAGEDTLLIIDKVVITGNNTPSDGGSDAGDGGSDSGDGGSGDATTPIIAANGASTVEVENAVNLNNAEVASVDSKSALINTLPGNPMTFDIEIEVETTGTYTLTFFRKNAGINGIYFEVKVDGSMVTNKGVGPSDEWNEEVTDGFEMTAGTHTLTIFAAPGESTQVYIDKVVFNGNN